MHAIQLISILVFSLYVVVVAVVLYNSAQQRIRADRNNPNKKLVYGIITGSSIITHQAHTRYI